MSSFFGAENKGLVKGESLRSKIPNEQFTLDHVVYYPESVDYLFVESIVTLTIYFFRNIGVLFQKSDRAEQQSGELPTLYLSYTFAFLIEYCRFVLLYL